MPLDGPARAYEAILRAVPSSSLRGVALQGKSVRPVSDADFATIVRAGLDATLAPENAVRLGLDRDRSDEEARALLDAPVEQQERRVVQVLQSRKLRDAAFRGQVVDAYDARCAVTGLRIVKGGGKAEAQAAHVCAVQDGGPDTVRNGIALSATVHWLFDRHLISLTHDYGLPVSHNRVPAELRPLCERQLERVILPKDGRLHPAYVARHRERYLASQAVPPVNPRVSRSKRPTIPVRRVPVDRNSWRAHARPASRGRGSAPWNTSVAASAERSVTGRRRRGVVRASATAGCASEPRARHSWPSSDFLRRRCAGPARPRPSRARTRWSEGSAGIAGRHRPIGRSTARMSA